MILTLSLSKIGLPGTRTGIVVAHPDIIREVAAMNAIVGLANNNLGQALTLGMIESGEIGPALSREVVRPFYAGRARFAISLMHENLPADLPWRLHRSEGSLFSLALAAGIAGVGAGTLPAAQGPRRHRGPWGTLFLWFGCRI
ncbi:MAG: hypothetical protein R3F31_18245 [Verrucomicrobiales bacterium]